mmetsp:Transcript_5633/g.12515  ORF Transcript_5633/g.12515 Transcript_5633/m.12515 type:complete len:200 (+) Transcript_5633:320-919(+)
MGPELHQGQERAAAHPARGPAAAARGGAQPAARRADPQLPRPLPRPPPPRRQGGREGRQEEAAARLVLVLLLFVVVVVVVIVVVIVFVDGDLLHIHVAAASSVAEIIPTGVVGVVAITRGDGVDQLAEFRRAGKVLVHPCPPAATRGCVPAEALRAALIESVGAGERNMPRRGESEGLVLLAVPVHAVARRGLVPPRRP